MIWEVELQKLLRHEGARFQVATSFRSDASRLVLFGPSGSGKTQTLRMIAGIVHPDQGRVAIGGRVLYDSAARLALSPQQRRLAYMFQDYALFPHLTVRQNIAFTRRTGWLNPPRRLEDEGVARWIQAFGLQPVVDHYPHQISGGQRQRTALARALVSEPTALLLDEPFAALDKHLRQRLRDELRDLVSGLNMPMLLITHDDDDVRAIAQEVVYLQAGQVVTQPAVAVEAAGG